MPTSHHTTRRYHHRRQPRRGAFTLLELLVVLAIITVLLALIVPAVSGMRRTSRSTACLVQLRQIALGFQHYAFANGGTFPDPLAADLSWEQTLLQYVSSADVYRCPADNELAESLGTSYDWRDTGDDATTLVGKSLSDARPGAVLAYDALPNWHAAQKMNAARVDGSVSSMDLTECLTNLMTPAVPQATP